MFDVRLENSFDFRSEEYRSLFERSEATAFQHPIWLDRLYGVLAPALNARPLVIVVRRAACGRLEMVLPLMRRRRGLLQVVEFADLEVSDYAAAVCEPAAFEEIIHDRLACAQIRDLLRPCDLLRIKKLTDNTPPLERLFGGSARFGMGMGAHAASLYPPFEDWRTANIAETYRRELDKKRRKLERRGDPTFQCVCEPRRIGEAFAALRAFRGERFPDDLLQQSVYFDFYLQVASRGAGTGFARTYALSLDGRPIGSVFGVEHRRRFLVLLSGADFANLKRLSVGALTFEDVASDCISRGVDTLDFTIGDEAYKQRFGAQPSVLWMMSLGATPPGKVAAFILDNAPWTARKTAGARDNVERRRPAFAVET